MSIITFRIRIEEAIYNLEQAKKETEAIFDRIDIQKIIEELKSMIK